MEHVYGVIHGREDRAVYINSINRVSPACDCYGFNDFPIVGDIGILASHDPVALDQACADLVIQAPGLPGGLPQGTVPRGGQIQGRLSPGGLAHPDGIRRTVGPGNQRVRVAENLRSGRRQ